MLQHLAENISGYASTVAVGLNWTLVEGPDAIGLAHSPARGTSGCFGLNCAGNHNGKSLAELAAGCNSDNPFDRALALASINAYFNRPQLEGKSTNGLNLFCHSDNLKTVSIGRFPAIENKFPRIKVIEKNPGVNDYPITESSNLLKSADQVIITASALNSEEFIDYLQFAENARIMIIGPSTPMSPLLFNNGISILAGFVITHPSKAIDIILQGGSIKQLKYCGRNVCLLRP